MPTILEVTEVSQEPNFYVRISLNKLHFFLPLRLMNVYANFLFMLFY